MNTALITGITSKDDGHPKELVRALDYQVVSERGDSRHLRSVKNGYILFTVARYIRASKIENYVQYDRSLQPPAECQALMGENSKAKEKLSWSPETLFEDLVGLPLNEDIRLNEEI
jgi:GDP-D-mannose dehydratase